jgi:hypothetical protein
MYDGLSTNYDNPKTVSSSNHDYDNPQVSGKTKFKELDNYSRFF